MIRQRALALLLRPGELELPQLAAAERRRAASVVQMGRANAFKRAHRAERVGKRQRDGVDVAAGAAFGQRLTHRLLAEKTVGVRPLIDGSPGLIELR